MGRDTKVQLGVRVPKEVRDAAVAKAKLTGESLNGYTERLIIQDVGGQPSIAPISGQIRLGVETKIDVENGNHAFGDDGDSFPESMSREVAAIEQRTPFDRACKNGTYHWKHGPGNPCRYCGGEI